MIKPGRFAATLLTAVALTAGAIGVPSPASAAAADCPRNAFCLWTSLDFNGAMLALYDSANLTGSKGFWNNTSMSAVNNTRSDVIINDGWLGTVPYGYVSPGHQLRTLGNYNNRVSAVGM